MKAVPNLKDLPYTKGTADLWIALESSLFEDVLYALYYLPIHYKLIVLNTTDPEASMKNFKHPELQNRVRFVPGHSGRLPTISHVIVSEQPKEDTLLVHVADNTILEHAYLVSVGYPAALASAIHEIARTAL
jgi:hypothetical protein